jgi:hypothetical protein
VGALEDLGLGSVRQAGEGTAEREGGQVPTGRTSGHAGLDGSEDCPRWCHGLSPKCICWLRKGGGRVTDFQGRVCDRGFDDLQRGRWMSSERASDAAWEPVDEKRRS